MAEHTDKIEIRPSNWRLDPVEANPTEAFYGGTKEAVLLHHETRVELARVPWWAGDNAVEEGDPVTVQGRRYRITAWGGRWVGRPAYVFVEPVGSGEEPAADVAAIPDLDSGKETR